MELIAFQDSLEAGPVGTVLPFLVIVRFGILSCIQYLSSVTGILEKSCKKIGIAFLQEAGFVEIGGHVQKVFVEIPVVAFAARIAKELCDFPGRLHKFLVRFLILHGSCGFYEVRVQEQALVQGQIGDNIVVLQLPKPFVQNAAGGADMRAVVSSAGAGSPEAVAFLFVADGVGLFAVCKRYFKAVSLAGGECAGAALHDSICLAAVLLAVIA